VVQTESPEPVARDRLREALRAATIGEFEIYDELGRGGMATVFLGYDIALDRHVAIKVMAPSLLLEEGMRERFRREARIAASLSHPHIVPVYTVRETPELAFFVMKYIDGQTLDSLIKEYAPLPLDLVQLVLTQIGQALGYAHARGVVHRDIKPGNILIDADGCAIVTDFGIARATGLSGLTATGASVGTPYYMSPEQCSRGEVTGLADQYALGVVAYQMIAGTLPFLGQDAAEVMQAHLLDPPPDLLAARPDCLPVIAGVVMRMLAKKAVDRWPTLDEAISALQAQPVDIVTQTRSRLAALAQSGSSRSLPVPPVSPSPSSRSIPFPLSPDTPGSRSSRARRVGLAVVVTAVVAGAGLWGWIQLNRRPGATPPTAPIEPAGLVVTPPPAPEPAPSPAPQTDSAAPKAGVTASVQPGQKREVRRTPVTPPPAPASQPTRPANEVAKDTATVQTSVANPVGGFARIRLGTKHPSAVIYINGEPRLPQGASLRWWEVRAGRVTIRLDEAGCTPWEETVTVRDTLTIGLRNPTCPQP
jgi:serine/threonine protein kinase